MIIAVSVLIPLIVTALAFVKIPVEHLGIDLLFFPKFHAFLNTLTTIALITGFFFIKNKNIAAHKKAMWLAVGLSVVFLMSYVFYHSISEPVRFGGEGVIRSIYFFILITHIILAALVLPFVLFTVARALSSQFSQHRSLARWTLPVWLYVTITGVVVYLMMAPYY